MARGGIPKPVGYETVWKDRNGRIRTKVRVADGRDYGKDRNMIDKRIVVYLDNHKEENWKDLKGYCIIHLDNDTTNFSPDNLVKVKKEVYLLMLNNRMLYNDPYLNKASIMTAEYIYKIKKLNKEKSNE